jgi:hypothetical protein
MAIAAEGIRVISRYLVPRTQRPRHDEQDASRGTFLSNLAALTDIQLRFLDRRLSEPDPGVRAH